LKNSVLKANFGNVFIFSECPSQGGHFDTKNSKNEAIIFFDVIEFGINQFDATTLSRYFSLTNPKY
jgi:hypothetical protein